MRFRLTKQADNDLDAIWNYTVEHWGEKQAVTYLRKIDAYCRRLSGDALLSNTPLLKYPKLQMVRCEHHYVFYIMEDVPLIIAVLHEKMDFMARLKRRLGGNP